MHAEVKVRLMIRLTLLMLSLLRLILRICLFIAEDNLWLLRRLGFLSILEEQWLLSRVDFPQLAHLCIDRLVATVLADSFNEVVVL